MIELADKVFAVKNDPDQLDVNEDVLEHLAEIHPASVSEYIDGDGPVAWILVIPTTERLMYMFLENTITEKELYEQTPVDEQYDVIYLCSALVLEEYRRKGITKRLTLEAIGKIRQDYPIKYLFTWPFSKEGDLASEKIAEEVGLPVFKRQHH